MQLGVHLPLADLGEGVPELGDLRAYARSATQLGFTVVSANDHLVWQRPWLDGPTALASVAADAPGSTLATSVALPVIRHPVVVAKTLASLAVLTGGPIIAGLGPGSSAADYRAVGVAFDQRWARFDESFAVVRALLHGHPPSAGRFYEVEPLAIAPLPESPPQLWFGSWGSDARLRRLAGIADGWLASAYNTTPTRFAHARARLRTHLEAAGRDASAFPDGVATLWLHVTEDPAEARHTLEDVLAPLLGREADELRAQVPVGPAQHCVHLLSGYASAGATLALLWPVVDPIGQLQTVAEQVLPELTKGP